MNGQKEFLLQFWASLILHQIFNDGNVISKVLKVLSNLYLLFVFASFVPVTLDGTVNFLQVYLLTDCPTWFYKLSSFFCCRDIWFETSLVAFWEENLRFVKWGWIGTHLPVRWFITTRDLNPQLRTCYLHVQVFQC